MSSEETIGKSEIPIIPLDSAQIAREQGFPTAWLTFLVVSTLISSFPRCNNQGDQQNPVNSWESSSKLQSAATELVGTTPATRKPSSTFVPHQKGPSKPGIPLNKNLRAANRRHKLVKGPSLPLCPSLLVTAAICANCQLVVVPRASHSISRGVVLSDWFSSIFNWEVNQAWSSRSTSLDRQASSGRRHVEQS